MENDLFSLNDYESKIQHQIDVSSFTELNINNSKNIEEEEINSWISKWILKGLLDNNWKKINLVHSKPGKMYGLVKTYKINNPVRVITSGCNAAVENLSI